MAGMRGIVEGPTKLATWFAFQKELKKLGHNSDTDPGIYGGGFYLIFPKNKKEAYERMVPAEDGSGWILEYYLHT